MVEILRRGISLKSRVDGPRELDVRAAEKVLLGDGLSICCFNELGRDKSALTNSVFSVTLIDSEGRRIAAILKVARGKVEPREIVLSDDDFPIGGWISSRLENEFNILSLVYQSGILSPKPIFYKKLDDGSEMLVEGYLIGQQGPRLRFPNVSVYEFREMERERGRLLAQINNIDHLKRRFGTLDSEARLFDNWTDYFMTKVSTTLSLLDGMYLELARLKRFGELVRSEVDWHAFIVEVARLYSNSNIQRLLREDNVPTLSHADYWDGNNIIRMRHSNNWAVSVIDFDRGGIEGRSFDLALWLSWKVPAKRAVNPTFAVRDFLDGYSQAGGVVSPHIQQYVAIYGLWQYLDFLVIDSIYGVDRTNKSVPEIGHLFKQLGEVGIK